MGLGLLKGSKQMRDMQLAAELDLDPGTLFLGKTIHSVIAEAITQKDVTPEYITVCFSCLHTSFFIGTMLI
jgi:hypothetical protein